MTEATEPTVDVIIGKYIKLRSKKSALKNAYEADVKPIDENLKKLEAWLQAKMLAENLKSLPTEAGTAYIASFEQATVSDMGQLLDYIKANDAWPLLEKRVSKTGVREILDAGQPLPPGINWYTAQTVNIRKPNER